MLYCRIGQERIDPLEKEAEIIKEMYDLIDAYKVPTPPEDFAVYQVSRGSYVHADSLLYYVDQIKHREQLSAAFGIKPRVLFLTKRKEIMIIHK